MTWFQVFYKTMTFQISTLHTDTLSTRQLEGLIDWVFIGVLEELFTSWCVEWASEVLTGSKIFALPTKDLPKPNQSNRLTGYLPTFINHTIHHSSNYWKTGVSEGLWNRREDC